MDVGCVEKGEEPWWPVHSFEDLGPGSWSMSVGCQTQTRDGESVWGAGRVSSCRALCNSA